MNRFRIDHQAQADLEEIFDYIARNNCSAASRLMLQFKERFRLLAGHPLMGQSRPELAPNLCSFTLGNYVIYYRPMKRGIEVARVLHAARDIDIVF
jgi:toxin ParE1/3/4